MSWDEAPDVITPLDLAKILRIGEAAARNKFKEKGFPIIENLGVTPRAEKEAVKLYLQGIKIKENSKEGLLYMILQELRKQNKEVG